VRRACRTGPAGTTATRLNLDTRTGDDDVSIGGQIYEGQLRTGAGNDLFDVSTTSFVRAFVDMGDGVDVLRFGGERSEYTLTSTSGDNYVFGSGSNRLDVLDVQAIVFGDGVILGDQALGAQHLP